MKGPDPMPLPTLRQAVLELPEAEAVAYGRRLLAQVDRTEAAGPDPLTCRRCAVTRSLAIAVLTHAAQLAHVDVDHIGADEDLVGEPVEWRHLVAAIAAMSELEAAAFGRFLVHQVHDVHERLTGPPPAPLARRLAIVHELGCALVDHADDQRRALEALEDDLEDGPAIGYQLGEDPPTGPKMGDDPPPSPPTDPGPAR